MPIYFAAPSMNYMLSNSGYLYRVVGRAMKDNHIDGAGEVKVLDLTLPSVSGRVRAT
ncbi:MAG: hypothetical protein P8Z30_14970 [Acidobacteriota bacterium]